MTREELIKMGAKPVTSQVPSQDTGFTREQLLQMGAKPEGQVKEVVEPKTEAKGVGGILGGITGFAKEAIDLPRKAAALGEYVGSKAADFVFGKTQATSAASQTLKEGVVRPEITKPIGTAEKVGAGIEQVGEFFLPIPGGAKAKALTAGIKVGAKAPAVVRGAAAIARPVARVALEGVEAATKSAVQQGELEGFGKEAAGQALFSAGLGVAGKAASGLGRAATQMLGKTTGAGDEALKLAFQNPTVMKVARKAGTADGASQVLDDALKDAQRGLQRIKESRGKEYTTALGRLKREKVDYGEILDDAKAKADELLSEFDVKTTKGGLMTPRSFRDSAIEQGKTTVQKTYRTLKTWRDTTPAGLDKLKKKLDQFKNAVRNTTDGSYPLIKGIRDRIDDGLKVNVSGYQQMTSKYREASELIDDIERALSLKQSAAKDTAVKKLMSTLRQNQEFRKEMLEVLSGKAGTDIGAKIAGATLAPVAPRGLAGVLSPAIGGFSFVANPASWPFLLLTIASTSPRLVGETISIMGQMKGKVPTPQIKQALQAILSQAMREPTEATSENPARP